MKKQFRLIALFIAIVMMLASCTAPTPDNGDESTETSEIVSQVESEETSKEAPVESSDEITTEAKTEETSVEATTTDEETTTEEETTQESATEKEEITDPPKFYYNTTHATSIKEFKAKITITDYDFVIAEWLLKRFENAALGLEEPPFPETDTESDTETDTESDTETDTETDTEIGYVDEIPENASNGEEETTGIDYDYVDSLYLEFEEKFLYIDTQVSIANIVYYYNMSDTEASELYLNVYGKFGELYNAYIDVCKNVYTNSPISDELFADWTEEDIAELFGYDPKTQELREEVESIQVILNDLTGEEPDYDDLTATYYAQIVTKNNEIARLEGYANYYEYASKEIYGRDYGTEELEAFSNYVAEYFAANIPDLYDNYVDAAGQLNNTAFNEVVDFIDKKAFDKLRINYLDVYIKSYEGSTREAFHHLFENGNFIVSKYPNSHPSAFQTYISGEGFDTPMCFFGSKGQTTFTVVHEMGHYYAALYNSDVNSFDLAETQSQANEMLLLAFLKDYMGTGVYNTIESYNMYNSIAMSVVCVIIDEFEREVYALESVEGYGSEEFDAIMAKVCEKYGGITYIDGYITDINSYWRAVAPNNPVYYISYATSTIAALNIYSVAKEDQQAARDIYRDLCENITEDDTLLTASEKVGLANIFEEQSFQDIIDAAL